MKLFINTMTMATYGFLGMSVILLWLPRRSIIPAWTFALTLAMVFGYISHQLTWLGMLFIFLFAGCVYDFYQVKESKPLHTFTGILLVLGGALFFTHQLPGFHNLKVINQVYLSQNAIPFNLYFNIDKAIAGILLLGIGQRLITTKKEWLALIKPLFFNLIIFIPIVIMLALLLGYVRFDPKLPSSLLIFTIANLLFISVPEEAFFRGLIQTQLTKYLDKQSFGPYLAILLTAVLHGVTHYPGGLKFIILATVASLGYGWVYYSTKKIEASILTHFFLNMTHYLFFTYPALLFKL